MLQELSVEGEALRCTTVTRKHSDVICHAEYMLGLGALLLNLVLEGRAVHTFTIAARAPSTDVP